MEDTKELHCGFIAIVGRPSSGKSTFLNRVAKGKVSIVSEMPQTTLSQIRGIARLIKKVKKPVFIAFNKIDSKKANANLSFLSLEKTFKDDLQYRISDAQNIKLFKISAKTGDGISNLLSALLDCLPISPLLYPKEFYTDQDVPFRISEIIREQIILNTKDEVPHSVYVKIEECKMQKNGKRLKVQATLFVDKESQKGILIGKAGSLIKKIREGAEKEMLLIFPYYVALQLNVKTDKNWRQREEVKI